MKTFIVTKKPVYLCCVILYSVPCKIVLFYIGAPLDELFPSKDNMISIEDFKSVVTDIVAAMAERVRMAEEKARNTFQNRTNIYRCEDGRPICYCCLRVGHVAKYCWDRRYSCRHASFRAPIHLPEPSPKRDCVDIQSLGKDVNKLLKELQQVTYHLQLSKTTPVQAKDIPPAPEYLTEDKDQVGSCTEMRSQAMIYGVRRPESRFVHGKRLPANKTENIVPGIYDYPGVT